MYEDLSILRHKSRLGRSATDKKQTFVRLLLLVGPRFVSIFPKRTAPDHSGSCIGVGLKSPAYVHTMWSGQWEPSSAGLYHFVRWSTRVYSHKPETNVRVFAGIRTTAMPTSGRPAPPKPPLAAPTVSIQHHIGQDDATAVIDSRDLTGREGDADGRDLSLPGLKRRTGRENATRCTPN